MEEKDGIVNSVQEVEVGPDGRIVSSSTFLSEQGKEIHRMREISGEVSDNRKLVKFLYLLARDTLPNGKIEALLDEACFGHGGQVLFTNGWLADWAKDAADRLE